MKRNVSMLVLGLSLLAWAGCSDKAVLPSDTTTVIQSAAGNTAPSPPKLPPAPKN